MSIKALSLAVWPVIIADAFFLFNQKNNVLIILNLSNKNSGHP